MNTVLPFFKLKDESGMPFELLALMAREKGFLPDWENFFMGACRAKWKASTIQKAVDEIATVYRWNEDPEFIKLTKMMWELAAKRVGWTETSWLAGRKERTVIKVEGTL